MDRRLAILRLIIFGSLGVLLVWLSGGSLVWLVPGLCSLGVGLMMPVFAATGPACGPCPNGRPLQVQADVGSYTSTGGTCVGCSNINGTYIMDVITSSASDCGYSKLFATSITSCAGCSGSGTSVNVGFNWYLSAGTYRIAGTVGISGPYTDFYEDNLGGTPESDCLGADTDITFLSTTSCGANPWCVHGTFHATSL